MNVEIGSLSSIRVVSFDLWQTLITGNAQPGKTRADMLFTLMQPSIDSEVFGQALKTVDAAIDLKSETDGLNYGPHERINSLCEYLGLPYLSETEMSQFYNDRTADLQINPPALLDPETPDILAELSQAHEVALISNTGFINGSEMRIALDALNILQYFKYQLFSNEVGHSKPHPEIFNALLRQSGAQAHQVLHVGDNPVADEAGAQVLGMQSRLIEKGVSLRRILDGVLDKVPESEKS